MPYQTNQFEENKIKLGDNAGLVDKPNYMTVSVCSYTIFRIPVQKVNDEDT